MDSFERLICTPMEAENYWTRGSYKVVLTQSEKVAIGSPSSPRPELDVLGLSFATNEILVMEVKSFLDSQGVMLAHLQEEHQKPAGRYKLFTSSNYRNVVLNRLRQDLIACGMANAETKIRLGLAIGKAHLGRTTEIRAHMETQGFVFWSPEDIKAKVQALASRGYENDPAIMVAKVLLR